MDELILLASSVPVRSFSPSLFPRRPPLLLPRGESARELILLTSPPSVILYPHPTRDWLDGVSARRRMPLTGVPDVVVDVDGDAAADEEEAGAALGVVALVLSTSLLALLALALDSSTSLPALLMLALLLLLLLPPTTSPREDQ